MPQFHLSLPVVLIAGLAATPAWGASTVVSGESDTRATALSGKLGSSSGAILDDPAASTGTSGLITSTANASAGPVPAGPISSLPGTTGIATGAASATLDLSTPDIFVASLITANTFTLLDGGTYLGDANAWFELRFTVDQATPYQLTGAFDVDDEDSLWSVQLFGPDGFLINTLSVADVLGSFNESGTLTAGTEYVFSGNVAVSETLTGSNPFAESSGLTAQLSLVPEPASASLLLAGAGLILARRRR